MAGGHVQGMATWTITTNPALPGPLTQHEAEVNLGEVLADVLLRLAAEAAADSRPTAA